MEYSELTRRGVSEELGYGGEEGFSFTATVCV